MPNPLTKEEIKNLAPEQQEALAQTELRRKCLRQQRWDRARRSRRWSIIAGVFVGLTGAVAFLGILFPRIWPIAVMLLLSVIGASVRILHERLDAILQLLSEDSKEAKPDK